MLDAATLLPQVSWGTNPSQTVTIDDDRPRSRRRSPTTALRESAKRALVYMGLKARTPMRDIAGRHRVHRVVHELAHRRPPRGRGRRRRPAREERRAHARRARVGGGEGAGRGRGSRQGVPRRRLRLARAGLLDVPGDEPRQARTRRTVRVHVEPQLRRPPGQGRAHAPRVPRRRRRHRDRRPLRHPERLWRTDGSRTSHHRDGRCRWCGPTSTPTRSSRATG